MLLSWASQQPGQRPATWTPLDLGADLLGWWDAEAFSTLTFGAGATITTWADKVAGYALTQAFSAQKPIYSASSFNNRPALTFDGVDDFLNLENQPFPNGINPCEVWFLGADLLPVATTGSRRIFCFGGNAITSSRTLLRVSSGTADLATATTGTGSGNTSVSDAGSDLRNNTVVRVRHEATKVRIATNGGAFSDSAATVPATGTTRVRMGSSIGDTASQFANVRLNGVLVTLALSAANATLLTNYLKNRGGI
jgi:hypothetical protein